MRKGLVPLEVEVHEGRRQADIEGPSSGGAMRNLSSVARAERRRSPYAHLPQFRPPPPSSLSSLAGHVGDMQLAPVSSRTRMRIRGGKITGGFARRPPARLMPITDAAGATGAAADPLLTSAAAGLRDASPSNLVGPEVRDWKRSDKPPPPAPAIEGPAPVRMSVIESREARKARRAKVRSEEDAALAAALAAKEEHERARVVRMLRDYDHEESAPPSPTSQLYLDAEEGASDPSGCRELRAKLRATATAAAKESPASEGSADWLRKPSGPLAPRLSSHAFAVFLKKLSLHQEALPDDAYVAEQLFVALDSAAAGELSIEQVVRGVFPAYSRVRSVRRRWVWATMYEPRGVKGWLSSTDIFHLLDGMPEGCRLEEVGSLLRGRVRVGVREGRRLERGLLPTAFDHSHPSAAHTRPHPHASATHKHQPSSTPLPIPRLGPARHHQGG